jgi:hypothetical protein
VALPQTAIGGILHDEKGDTLFYPKLEDTDNMGMREPSHDAGLGAQFFTLLTCEPSMEYFDSCLGTEVEMFAQIDVGKVTSPNKMEELIVTEVSSNTVTQSPPPHGIFALPLPTSPEKREAYLS